METLLRVGLGNAVAAGLLALAAASVGVFARGRPALRHGLWILVLLKLVTPPLWTVPVAWVAEPLEPETQGPETLARLPAGGQAPLVPAPEPDGLVENDPQNEDAPAAAIPAPVSSRAPALAERPWRGWAFMLWGAGSLLTFGVAAGRIRQFQRAPETGRAGAGVASAEGRGTRSAGRLGASAGDRSGPWGGFAARLVPGAPGLPDRAARALGPARRAAARHAVGPRAGAPEAARPLGPVPRAAGDGALLVAARRLDRAACLARSRGAMLRRLGRLGLPRRNPDVCRGAVGDAGFPLRSWAGGRSWPPVGSVRFTT